MFLFLIDGLATREYENEKKKTAIGPSTELVIFLDDVLASGATYLQAQESLAERGVHPQNVHGLFILNLAHKDVYKLIYKLI